MGNINSTTGLKNTGHYIIIIFILSVTIKTLYFYHFQENPFSEVILKSTDSINFDIGAQSFSSGDLLATSPNNSYSPLYKYFIGFIYLFVGRNLEIVWAIQLLIGVFTTLLIFQITLKLFNARSAFFGALLFSFYGPGLMYEGTLLRASLITFLGVLSLYLLILMKEEKSLFRVLMSGLAISMFIQSRPNVIIVFILLLFIPPYIFDKQSLNETLPLTLLVLLFFIPLLSQASFVHGKFVFFDSGGPSVILMGNNPDYPGATWIPQLRYQGIEGETYNGLFFSFIKNLFSNPAGMIALYLRKLYFFLNSYEFPSNYNFYIFQEFSFLLKTPLSYFSIFSGLGIMGFLINLHDFKRLRLLNAFLMGMTSAVILVYVVSRFRVPAVPYYAIYAGCLLDKLCTWRKHKKHKKLFYAIIMIFFIQLFFNSIPDASNEDVSLGYVNLGNAYGASGKKNKAELMYKKSLELHPDSFYSRNNLAYIYHEKASHLGNDYETAIITLNKAISLHLKNYNSFKNGSFKSPEYKIAISNLGKTYNSLGEIYAKLEQLNIAIEHFKLALKYKPDYPVGHYNLGKVYELRGMLDDSIEEYSEALNRNHDFFKACFALATAFNKKRVFQKAIEVYFKCSKINPSFPKTYFAIGDIYVKTNNLDKAQYYFHRGAELNKKLSQGNQFLDNTKKD